LTFTLDTLSGTKPRISSCWSSAAGSGKSNRNEQVVALATSRLASSRFATIGSGGPTKLGPTGFRIQPIFLWYSPRKQRFPC
jgi:hypothetical protein